MLHAGTGQPHRVAGDVVVAAVGALGGRLAAELAAEEHQRLVQQPALFQVGEQRGGRLVDGPAAVDQPLVQVVVVVPARLADLDEPHAGLAQSAGHQALAGERAGRAGLHAVGVQHGLRLVGDVEQLGHLALHPEGQPMLRRKEFVLAPKTAPGPRNP